MDLEFVPLLRVQRQLHDPPPGAERFRTYLRTMINERTGDLELPLVAMNPMGGDHVAGLLDRLLAVNADGAGAAATATAATQPAICCADGRFRVALVVADDARGGWTNRYQSEFDHCFEGDALYRRGWITAVVWTSEEPTAKAAWRATTAAIHRVAHIRRFGPARSLRAMLAQEGAALAAAGYREPSLDPDDLATTREAMTPYLRAEDRPTTVACLYGDEAARTLGYPPLGFNPRAGFALALESARAPELRERRSRQTRIP